MSVAISCTWKGTQYLKSECFYGYKKGQYAVLIILLQLIQLSQFISHTTTVQSVIVYFY